MQQVLLLSLFSFLSFTGFAQVCSGIPGPILYLEDFGSGPNPGPELPAGTTTYSFGLGGGGLYYVTNDSGQNGALWHSAPDHTEGDTDGYMLLFDASAEAGTFFEIILEDVCPNTQYVFSCFVANIVVPTACGNGGIEPDLRFTIIDPATNTTIQNVTSGSIPVSSELEWREIGVSFRTQAGQNSILVQVTNNAPGGCGNDLVLDDFNLRLCNPFLEQTFDLCEVPGGSVTVGTNTYTQAGLYEDLLPIAGSCNDSTVVTTLLGEQVRLPTQRFVFCEGESVIVDGVEYFDSINFVDTLGGGPCPELQPYEIVSQAPQLINQSLFLCLGSSIQVGNNTYTEAGLYIDSLLTAAGCDSVVVTEIETAGIAVSINASNFELELGETILLQTSISFSNDPIYSWLPPEAFSCTDCPDPIFQPVSTGVYTLIATDSPSGCTDTLNFNAEVLPCDGIFIPNAFSPNNDGVNDRFELFAKPCYRQVKAVQVFDRWGGLVYQQMELPAAFGTPLWNGRVGQELPEQGVYVYQIEMELIDGTTQLLSGDVLVLP